MDPEMAVKVRALLKTLRGSRTVLLSTHSLAEASLVCQRAFVLHQGRLLAQGTPQELFPDQLVTPTPEEIFLRLAASRTPLSHYQR
jgi:ABC-type multidrug transport system ATPase subunit